MFPRAFPDMQAIERQAAAGIAEAAALILVVDGQTGVTSSDEEVVSWLRKTHPKKPVSCVAAGVKVQHGSPHRVRG